MSSCEKTKTADRTIVEAPKRFRVVVVFEEVSRILTFPYGANPTTVTVGRGDDNRIVVQDPELSKNHFELSVRESAILVKDLGSRNGTHIGDRRIERDQEVEVQPGQAIVAANTMITVQTGPVGPGVDRARLDDQLARACVLWDRFALIRTRSATPNAVRQVLGRFEAEELFQCRVSATEQLVLCPGDAKEWIRKVKRALDDARAHAALFAVEYPVDGKGPDALKDALERVRAERDEAIVMSPSDPGMLAVCDEAMKYARHAEPVLILGESGVGKNVLAKQIHSASPRSHGEFVKVDCAHISETLFENEMFGHEAGAFADARQRQSGLVEDAHRGTLFFDEIGEVPWHLQSKLLSVLEDRTIRRLGGGKPVPVDVRFIFATNRNPDEMVHAGEFRRDLYHRIDAFRVHIPPLRERPIELIELARGHVLRVAADLGIAPPKLSSELERWLVQQRWEGNVRQLQNVLRRTLVKADGGPLTVAALQRDLRARAEPAPTTTAEPPPSSERSRLKRALEENEWRMDRTATALGISQPTLRTRMRRVDLKTPRQRD